MATDLTDALCFWPENSRRRFHLSQIDAYQWGNLDHDGKPDVVATVSYTATARSPKLLDDTCPAALEAIKQRLAKTTHVARLEFVVGAKGYAPTAKTVEVLRHFDRSD